MSVHKRFISLFFSICVLVAFMFQSAHTYSHLVHEYFGKQTTSHTHHSKTEKAVKHHSEDCQICHFTLSPFTTLSFDTMVFYTNSIYQKSNVIYHFDFVEISFDYFSLRAPPVYV
ncbi:MAG TPA: hypothetical protein VLY87_05410 [Flavobacterium sp.]|nr:hypothetical protein [Flavobacterium sp.]